MGNKETKEVVYEDEDVGLVDFSDLPEGCISNIISLTSPLDACTCCLVSSVFKSAAESDSVWGKFLPSDYPEILARSSSSFVLDLLSKTKKELYYSLCHYPILIDGGLKSFSLAKRNGKKCYMLGAKDLTITWGSTPQYWEWKPFPGSRFAEVAELRAVCWLEIHGTMETRLLSPKTTYAVYFVCKLREGAYGFDPAPVTAVIQISGGGGNSECSGEKEIWLDTDDLRRRQLRIEPYGMGLMRLRFRPLELLSRWEGQFPQERGDGWLEIEMGHFFNHGEVGEEVQMTLKETADGSWKSGLIIEGIELRPKENI